MLVDISNLSTDYAYNNLVERKIASLLSIESGLTAHDFGDNRARPEYDFMLGSLPMELKMTSNIHIPVEVSKDKEGLIPSGISVSIAPYILYISNGRTTGSVPCAKVRMFKRSWLLSTAKLYEPTFYEGARAKSESALVHYIRTNFYTGDLWLGDMPYVEDNGRWMIDLSRFAPSYQCGMLLNAVHDSYLSGDIN